MSTKSTEESERKLTLPPGHPKASYVSPDLSSGADGIEQHAPDEQERQDKLAAKHEEEVKAAEESEDKAAREEQEALAKRREAELDRYRNAPPGTLTLEQQAILANADEQADAEAAPTKTTAKTSSSSSASSSS